jgi:preprotein translocase subunit YajC
MPNSSTLSTLALVAFMAAAFYLLIIRPQRRRQQAIQKTMSELEPGTRVMLGSGLFGTVVSVGEKQIVLEISPGAQLTVLKQAVARVVTESDEDIEEPEDEDEDEEQEGIQDAPSVSADPMIGDVRRPSGTEAAPPPSETKPETGVSEGEPRAGSTGVKD